MLSRKHKIEDFLIIIIIFDYTELKVLIIYLFIYNFYNHYNP